MKNTVTILINKPYEFDKDENLYVGIFLGINIAGLSIDINNAICQLQLDVQHLKDDEIQIGIGNNVFIAKSGTTYTEDDDEDDEDYNYYEFEIEEAISLINYILYELLPTEDDFDEEEDEQYDIRYAAPNAENVKSVLTKIDAKETITVEDINLLINNVKR